METPPASTGGEVETLVAANEDAAAAAEEKVQRTRKRSRYLSSPYTDPVADAADDDGPRRRQEQGKNDDAEAYSLLLQQLPEADVTAADLLSALHGAALFDVSPSPDNASASVATGDADVLLRLFTLHRRSKSLLYLDANGNTASTTKINKDGDGASPSPVVAGHKLLNAGPCRAMADADASAGKNASRASKKEDENGHHIGAATASAAAAAIEAGHKRKKVAMASSSDGPNATGGSLAQSTSGVANSAPPKRKRNRKKKAGQGQHFSNPVALLLDFTQDTVLPSKEKLISAFRRFGFVIESETDIATDTRRARIVFGTSAEAEAAFSSAETLGEFGPPLATLQLQHLPPIKLDVPQQPSPARKLPLTDIRKNLEKMISSLTCPSSFRKDGDGAKPAAHSLVGEMQGLLAKVDGMLSAKPPSSTTALHRH